MVFTLTHTFYIFFIPPTLSWLPQTDSVDDFCCQAALSVHCHTITASVSLHCSTPSIWSCPHCLCGLLCLPKRSLPPPPRFALRLHLAILQIHLVSNHRLTFSLPSNTNSPFHVGGEDGNGSIIIGFQRTLMLGWMIYSGSCCACVGFAESAVPSGQVLNFIWQSEGVIILTSTLTHKMQGCSVCDITYSYQRGRFELTKRWSLVWECLKWIYPLITSVLAFLLDFGQCLNTVLTVIPLHTLFQFSVEMLDLANKLQNIQRSNYIFWPIITLKTRSLKVMRFLKWTQTFLSFWSGPTWTKAAFMVFRCTWVWKHAFIHCLLEIQ